MRKKHCVGILVLPYINPTELFYLDFRKDPAISSIIKKGQQWMFFLHKLRKFNLPV